MNDPKRWRVDGPAEIRAVLAAHVPAPRMSIDAWARLRVASAKPVKFAPWSSIAKVGLGAVAAVALANAARNVTTESVGDAVIPIARPAIVRYGARESGSHSDSYKLALTGVDHESVAHTVPSAAKLRVAASTPEPAQGEVAWPAPAPVVASSASVDVDQTNAEDHLAEEVRLLDSARAAPSFSRAQAILEEHAMRFPNGELAPERERLRAQFR